MRKHDYLICVDSDGCAMDTMNSKHERCFGPAMIQVWGLEEKKQEVQQCWNRINLFSETRGINRFLALALVLKEQVISSDMDGFGEFETWTRMTKELSSDSLKQWMETHDSACCRKAYEWTHLVNKKIENMPSDENKAFPQVWEVLCRIHQKADVAVVSSANRIAVKAEWEREGLLPFVDKLMTQEDGSKASCIRKLLDGGYLQKKVLMVGDAPGDLLAARENQVLFYPILPGREEESWQKLGEIVFDCFYNGCYEGAMEQEEEREFHMHLNSAKA